MKSALLLLLAVPLVEAQGSMRVLGVGAGTFIIILAIVFSLLCCLACRASSNVEIYSVIGALLPIILIFVFVFTPKVQDKPAIVTETDSNFVPHIIFVVLGLLGLLLGAVPLTLIHLMTYKRAKSVARPAFMVRNENEEQAGPASPLRNVVSASLLPAQLSQSHLQPS